MKKSLDSDKCSHLSQPIWVKGRMGVRGGWMGRKVVEIKESEWK